MKYVMYIKKTCPFCVKAQRFLQEQKKDFKIVDFEENDNVLQNIKEAYNWSTVPMIFELEDQEHNIKLIGGYTDLLEYFQQLDG